MRRQHTLHAEALRAALAMFSTCVGIGSAPSTDHTRYDQRRAKHEAGAGEDELGGHQLLHAAGAGHAATSCLRARTRTPASYRASEAWQKPSTRRSGLPFPAGRGRMLDGTLGPPCRSWASAINSCLHAPCMDKITRTPS
jgi:hypothetical protein